MILRDFCMCRVLQKCLISILLTNFVGLCKMQKCISCFNKPYDIATTCLRVISLWTLSHVSMFISHLTLSYVSVSQDTTSCFHVWSSLDTTSYVLLFFYLIRRCYDFMYISWLTLCRMARSQMWNEHGNNHSFRCEKRPCVPWQWQHWTSALMVHITAIPCWQHHAPSIDSKLAAFCSSNQFVKIYCGPKREKISFSRHYLG